MSKLLDFVFVDDEAISNMICHMTVEATLGKGVRTQTFINPKDALEYLKKFKPFYLETQTVLFIDINMPAMTGWEFLDAFDQLDAEIKRAVSIYILSSSIDPRDRQRSYASKNVIDYIVKPLALDKVNQIARSVKSANWLPAPVPNK